MLISNSEITFRIDIDFPDSEVKTICGLMMGTYHLVCACSFEDFTPALVNKANTIVQAVFERYLVYHQS